ncbi:MAG: GGDEF domain-containing protein [Simplicispira sp.]|nr:GGDEF domain-containing protein [Simplicispira sp.]
MIANLIVGMLCVHLLCFAAMFWLISTRLQENKLGMNAFAVGNAMLGSAYVLQLLGGPPDWEALSVVNHTLTLCVPLVYAVGALRFFGRPTPLLQPVLALALAYTVAQALVQWLAGPVARYAMLSFASALMFLAMTGGVVHAMRNVAIDLRVEMTLFALLIGGLAVLNLIKGVLVAQGGLQALDMGNRFQIGFYIYMSFLATVLAPSMIWLVLRRLTDALRATAARDPLTQLLNRRGLLAGLEAYFRTRAAAPARLVMLDIDHFKRINDSYGHQAGDLVLSQVAEVLRQTLRRGDLASRTGGEEFVAVCLGVDDGGVLQLAERLRAAIERQEVRLPGVQGPVRCTVTVGVSLPFDGLKGLEAAMQQADAALYRGKQAGRNRVELGHTGGGEPEVAPRASPA